MLPRKLQRGASDAENAALVASERHAFTKARADANLGIHRAHDKPFENMLKVPRSTGTTPVNRSRKLAALDIK